MIGARIPKLTDVTVRLAEMDAQGVDRQWVSASPNHFYPWAPEGLAVWVANEANRLVAEHVAQAPDRLTGLGLVPLQHPERIVECLDDAVLGRGLAGVEISSFAGDVELSDPRLEPFWARAAELRADRLPAPVRLQPRRAPRPVLPLQHRRSAGRERRRAVAPDLRGRARSASGSQDRRRARRRLPADRDRTLRPRVAGAARGAALRARAVDLPAQDLVRHGRARPARAAHARRGRRRIAGRARQRLPVRHGRSTTRSRSCAGPGCRTSSTDAHPRRQRRRAARDRGCAHEDRAVAARRRAIGEGFVIDDRVVPFPDGLTVADVLAAGLDAAHELRSRSLSDAKRHERPRSPTFSCSPRSCRQRSATSSPSRSTSRASAPRSTARARWSPSGTRRRRSTSPTRTRSSARASRCARR